MSNFKRVNVLGVGLSAINLSLAREAVAQALEQKTKGYVCVTGVHGVTEAQKDDPLRVILNQSFLNTPDGMPMVWMGKLHGFREMDRVYGPDLMLLICEFTQAKGYTHFLYGGGGLLKVTSHEVSIACFAIRLHIGKKCFLSVYVQLSATNKIRIDSTIASVSPFRGFCGCGLNVSIFTHSTRS